MKPKIEFIPEHRDFREMIDFSINKFKSNIAYKYKENPKSKVIIEKTYETVGNDTKALATALLERGFEKKRIAVISSNRYEWVITYFAAQTGDMVIAPMDKMLPEIEIESLVQRSSVEAVFFEKSNLEVFKRLKESKTNSLSLIVCMDDVNEDGVVKYSDLVKEGYDLIAKGNNKYDNVEIDNEKMSIMLFTSGTTEQSKIVMLSQKNIQSNVAAIQNHFKMLPTDVLLSILPIHHTFESTITIIYGFYSGSTICFCDGLRYISDNLKEYEVTIFVAVPLLIETIYKKIKNGIDEKGKTKLVNTMVKISNGLLKCHIDIRRKLFKSILDNLGGKLRIMLYGAAALDKETIIGFNNFGLTSIQGYGLTETSPVLVAESETRHRPGSAGFALDNVQIKILDPNKEGIGNIVVKGPNVFLGYYGDVRKTEDAFVDGWFKTGDYGYIDKDGFLFITGREKDIIVLRNGKNVYPQEIETLINRLPYVKESMVYARNSSKTDTVLVAKIVYDEQEMKNRFPDSKKENYHDLIWKDVKTINNDLVNYKHIKQITVTDEPMIKTTTQKIKRYEEIKKEEKTK